MINCKKLGTMSRLQVISVEGVSSAYCNYDETHGSLSPHFGDSKTLYMISAFIWERIKLVMFYEAFHKDLLPSSSQLYLLGNANKGRIGGLP